MKDKLITENYLLVLKSTVEVFVHGTLESSNENTRNVLKTSLEKIMTLQASTYDEMTKYGWYQINNVENNMIKQTLNKVLNSN